MRARLLLPVAISSVIFLALGIVFIVVPGESVAAFLFILFGILTILFHIRPFLEASGNLKYNTPAAWGQFLSALLPLIIGVLLIFFQHTLSLAVGIVMLACSAARILMAKSAWAGALVREAPRLLLAVLLLVFGIGAVVDLLLTILGWIFVTVALLSIIVSVLSLLKRN